MSNNSQGPSVTGHVMSAELSFLFDFNMVVYLHTYSMYKLARTSCHVLQENRNECSSSCIIMQIMCMFGAIKLVTSRCRSLLIRISVCTYVDTCCIYYLYV